jgi:dipeptidyl-peptidase 4
METQSRRAAARVSIVLLVLAQVPLGASAQDRAGAAPHALTAADYARAERFLGDNVTPLVLRSGVRATWLPDDRLWYRNAVAEGTAFVLVDPARGTRGPAFDHARIAAALSAATGTTRDRWHLPFTRFDFTADGASIRVTVDGKRWSCALTGASCAADTGTEPPPETPAPAAGRGAARGPGARPESVSPDGKRAAFIRDNNLWAREVATGRESPLTTDGVKDFGYATDNAGWTKSDRPVLLWSPDSKKIATCQQDQRGVGEMYLVNTTAGHPTLQAWKYPLPGDATVTTIQRVVIHLDGPRVVRLKMPPDQHRSTVTDDIKADSGELADAQWSADASRLAFVSTSRDHRHEVLRIADPESGDVRDVFEEKVSTFFESGDGAHNWRVLFASNEVIWFSERDNWGHLYLYDLGTGALVRQITAGAGNVTRVLRVDEKARTVWFEAVGLEKGRDPYFRHVYRIGLDGRNLVRLTPDVGDHVVDLSPSGRYFIDTWSQPDVPPVAVLRGSDGKLVVALEQADISKLLATGWKAPAPFTVKARDGVTDLYGLMFTPSNLDTAKKYPIVNNIYPGPQTGSVSGRAFSPARGDCQALAELGFIVVQIDGMGTPKRSKTFHEAYYGDMGDNTLPDQVAGMKQLAERFPWIDLERAGIWGHSGGGFAAAAAMFRYPDFFKVGISESGNHDNRAYEDDWGEKWQGLLEKRNDGGGTYDDQANQHRAASLKGRLLLAHGTLDANVPPYNTLLVVDALIKANKDFDLLLLPNQGHGYGSAGGYMTRRRWDYFVRHLMGAEPPTGYELKTSTGRRPGGPGE